MLSSARRRWFLRVVLFAAVLLSAAQATLALDPRRPLASYLPDVWQEPLPQQMVQSVFQTSDGAIWLGTYEGIVRFNGIDFTTYDRRNHPEITDWRVRSLGEERPGTLWAGTIGGGALRFRDGAFRRYTTKDGLPSDTVTTVRRLRDGTIWFGTALGLARLRNDRIEPVGTLRPAIESFTEAPDGTLIVGAEDGLYRFAAGELEQVRLTPGRTEPRILSVAIAKSGEIWAGSQGDGVFRLKGTAVTHVAQIGKVSGSWVNFIVEDRDGVIWIGLAPGGLARFAHDRFEVLDESQGLPSTSIRSATEDVEGSLWIGTNGGLARIKDLEFFGLTRRTGLTEDYIRVVLEAKDGGLWVGTYGDGMNHVAKDGTVTAIGTAQGLSDHYVRTIAEDLDGALWVGTGNGLNRIVRGSRPTVERIDGRNGLSGSKINALLVRRDGGIIVAADGAPLQLGVRQKFAPLPMDRQEVVADARILYEDRGGDLWIGTGQSGLLRTRNGRTIRAWTTREGLPSDSVFSLYESAGGDVWIGTHAGLALLRNGTVTAFQAPDALPVETIFQILDDDGGFFWLTTNHGVIRVSRKSLLGFAERRGGSVDWTRFGKRDGMPVAQCNGATQPAGIRMRDGRLAIPTVSGLALVDPADLRQNQVPPPVRLVQIGVDGRILDASSPADLGWSADRFEFRYEALSLEQPELVTFRYKVDGYDRDWVDAGTRRTAFYNTLPAGEHTFRVQARNNDGVWSRGEATWQFVLATPPWRRWWAIAGYVALLALLVYLISRLSLRVLRRETERLEQKVAERTSQLQETNLRLMQTSYELEEANRRLAELSTTDSLTSIANRRLFDQMLATELRRARRNASELSLLFVDIDHFKAFNDRYGHQAGDDTLRQVAQTLSDSFARASDVVARYGGEEFAVLLPSMPLAEAARAADHARADVERLAIPHDASPTSPFVTITIGVASTTHASPGDASALIAAADAALYRAKRSGRNRIDSERADAMTTADGRDSQS